MNTELRNSIGDPLQLVMAHYDSMSKAQKRIANFLLKEGETACFMTLKALSAEADVSPVTVIRFAQRLGFSDFNQLKDALQRYIQTIVTSKSVLQRPLDKLDDAENALEKISYNELKLLSSTYDELDEAEVTRAVQLLKGARKVFIVAQSLSRSLAQIFYVRLTQLNIDAVIVTHEYLNILPIQLCRADDRDVFVILSFPNYARITGDIARCVKGQGCKIICITDDPSSPPSASADIVFLCRTMNLAFYNSMTAPLSVLNTLATMLAMEMKGKARDSGQDAISDLFLGFQE